MLGTFWRVQTYNVNPVPKIESSGAFGNISCRLSLTLEKQTELLFVVLVAIWNVGRAEIAEKHVTGVRRGFESLHLAPCTLLEVSYWLVAFIAVVVLVCLPLCLSAGQLQAA